MRSLAIRAIGFLAFVMAGSAAAVAQTPTSIGWAADAATLRGNNGQRFEFLCPAAPAPPLATIRGTDIYADDSAICVAALHSGAIMQGGGRVMIEILPGQASYKGTQQNGVTSQSFGPFNGSYQVIGGAPADQAIDWITAAQGYRGQSGVQLVFFCPPQPTGYTPRTIWGTGIYTDDSAICLAAVHAGAITAAGGTVTIEILPGQDEYKGSIQNGVTSQPYGNWFGSYRVTGGG